MAAIRRWVCLATLLPVVTSAPLFAQNPPARDSVRVFQGAVVQTRAPLDQALEESLFPPTMILENQAKIGLSPVQRDSIRAAVRKFEMSTLENQWKLQDENDRFAEILKRPTPSEGTILDQLDRVLGAERELKRAQMAMLVRLRTILTPDQQTKLRTLIKPRPK